MIFSFISIYFILSNLILDNGTLYGMRQLCNETHSITLLFNSTDCRGELADVEGNPAIGNFSLLSSSFTLPLSILLLARTATRPASRLAEFGDRSNFWISIFLNISNIINFSTISMLLKQYKYQF